MTKKCIKGSIVRAMSVCCRLYGSSHRVDRVLCFLSSRWNWDSPLHPLTRRRTCPPPFGSGGRGTLAWERGWGSPNSDAGTYTVELYLYMYMNLRGPTFPLGDLATQRQVPPLSYLFFFLYSSPKFATRQQGRTQIIRQRKSMVFFPFIVP